MTRRETLWHGATGFALVCSFDKVARLASAPSGKPGAARRGEVTDPFEPFQVDLPRPPVLEPVLKTPTVERYEIAMREAVAEILPGYETPIMGYEGIFPGPTVLARRGRRTVIRQTNELSEHTSVHLHGGLVPESSDGGLHEYHVAPGAARTYYYPNTQRQSTLWYHDHVHGLVGPHLNAGLTAFYLLSDGEDRRLELPSGARDVPLMIQDRSFLDDGSLAYAQNLGAGFFGDTILVNGAVAPRMRVKRRLYRLRLLNASNARCYELVLGNNRPMHQIATDGGLLPAPVTRRRISLAPAERVEVLVDFGDFAAGTELIMRNAIGEASTTAVMRFDVTGKAGGRDRIPKRLGTLGKLPAAATTRDITLNFQEDPAEWQINGQGFDPDRIDWEPELGSTEIWRFINESEHAHPMHLHGCHFRVVSIGGSKPTGADRGWKDTVHVLPDQTIAVRPHFEAYSGRYVMHCHTAEHSDVAMMAIMEITQ
jgi:FtsP/CotA-like multicopper oxidase with cupredoxin domain